MGGRRTSDWSKSRTGVLYGIGAYGLWGLIPLYFKAVAQVTPLEVLAHRAMWSFAIYTWDSLQAAQADRIRIVEPD